MVRSSQADKARHLNAALEILKTSASRSRAAEALASQQQLSTRQAYRYLREAEQMEEAVPVPSPKVTFTIKLPRDLVDDLRAHARARGSSISDLVAQALRVFLLNGRGG